MVTKVYWKVENVAEVQRRSRVEFGTPPPPRVTIIRIRDKFEIDGTVQEVLKGQCGRNRKKKSLRQCSREIGRPIKKFSVHRILNMPSMIFH